MQNKRYFGLLVVAVLLTIFQSRLLEVVAAVCNDLNRPWIGTDVVIVLGLLIIVAITSAPLMGLYALYKLRQPLLKIATWLLALVLFCSFRLMALDFLERSQHGCCIYLSPEDFGVVRQSLCPAWNWDDEFDFYLYGDGEREGMLDMTPFGSEWVRLCPPSATVLDLMDESDELHERRAVYTAARELQRQGRIDWSVPLPPKPLGTPENI
jgi:hypothetical protein